MIKNIILSTLTIAVLAGCSGKQASEKDTDAVEPIPVKVQKLEKQDIARTLDYTANLQADEQVYYVTGSVREWSAINSLNISISFIFSTL